MRRNKIIFSFLLALLSFSLIAEAATSKKPTTLIFISIKEQKLWLYDNKKFVKSYPISSSKYGIGSQLGSQKTPLGWHAVAKKIGDGAPIGTIFKSRMNTHKTIAINPKPTVTPGDYVLTRILWLKGLEPGKNKDGHVDSYRRCIYIHGTPDEGLIGQPASHGCIRMKNADVIDLYNRVEVSTPVRILPSVN